VSRGELETGKRRRPAAKAVRAEQDVKQDVKKAKHAKDARDAKDPNAANQAKDVLSESKPSSRKSAVARAVVAQAARQISRRVAARAAAESDESVSPETIERVATEIAQVATEVATEPPLNDMERDLAGLLSDIDGAEGNAEARRRGADAIGRIAARLYPDAPASNNEDDRLLASARQLLSTDYYLKQWGRFGMRGRSDQVDDFGFDPAYEERAQPLLDLLYDRYFRVRIQGAENIPAQGAALLVCNRAGALPWDGVMLKTALRKARPDRRPLRWLIDDFVFHSPFLGGVLSRIGAARACPENAQRLLEGDELLAVFPEGVKGIGKPFRERYQLQRFGRGGHVKLALRARVPVIPLAIVGSEESYPLVYKLRAFSKLVGMPFIPVTPLFPWFGPLGLVPLPSRWQIIVGEPMHEFDGLEPRAAEDTVLVNDLNEQLRAKVQSLLQTALRERGPNAFF
jgi:1-acyl-sn-glycerol-3-phosphate acyltransferase